MCELVRRHQPQATIVVGGHVANRPGLARRRRRRPRGRGRGRRLVPRVPRRGRGARRSGTRSSCPRFGARTMGVPFGQGEGETAATVIPSVGCPLGCNFCSTSAMFGGKGRFFSFYEGGDELFEVMRDLEQAPERALVLRDGRELPPPPQARPAPPGADARARQGVGPLRLQLGERAPAVHGRRARGPRGLLGLARPRGRGQRLREAQGHRHPGPRAPAPGPRHPRPRLEHRRPRRARGRQHRPRDRPRGRARHRVPPVHALHAGAGHAAPRRAPGERHPALRRGVPGRRHPRAAALQLPPPAHPERRGDGVPAAGLPPRLRGERPERHPHRAHAPPGLARPEGPPRPARARPGRVRDEGPRHAVRGSAVGVRAVVRAAEPGARRPPAGDPPRRSSGSSAGRRASPRASSARWSSRRSGARSAACAAAGPTSRRPSTRRTRPRPRDPRWRRAGLAACRWVEPPARRRGAKPSPDGPRHPESAASSRPNGAPPRIHSRGAGQALASAFS